jgi:hypothetical protein
LINEVDRLDKDVILLSTLDRLFLKTQNACIEIKPIAADTIAQTQTLQNK